ncbi:hypothetical protein JJJA_0024 [Achromobacter phage JWDelta]|uniref:Uncharacterized protein n=1 Tax=Achromobacter phage JWDelta TaxID=1416008 RepID=V9SK84_9CAUD|nr:hypothetical protein JJJA_0024 [Achromobacter phage JWDelta]
MSTHGDKRTPSMDALASAPVAGEAQERIEQMAVNRYRSVPDGNFSYKVVAGDGTRSLYTGTKDACLRVASKLTEAFLDGAFVASDAAPQASEAVRDTGHPVFAFLLGEGPLRGVHFGDRHPDERGAFWWRKDLRAALSAQSKK